MMNTLMGRWMDERKLESIILLVSITCIASLLSRAIWLAPSGSRLGLLLSGT